MGFSYCSGRVSAFCQDEHRHWLALYCVCGLPWTMAFTSALDLRNTSACLAWEPCLLPPSWNLPGKTLLLTLHNAAWAPASLLLQNLVGTRCRFFVIQPCLVPVVISVCQGSLLSKISPCSSSLSVQTCVCASLLGCSLTLQRGWPTTVT